MSNKKKKDRNVADSLEKNILHSLMFLGQNENSFDAKWVLSV